MKQFWSWLRSIFGHKDAPKASNSIPATPQANPTPPIASTGLVTPGKGTVSPISVPAPEPTKATVPPPVAPVATIEPSSAPAPAPPEAPNAPTPSPAPIAPVPVSPVPPAPIPVEPVVKEPTFTDDFSLGHLDTSKWIPSNWNAPGGIPGVHHGVFVPSALDFSHGCLRIRVSQTKNPDGSITSQGGELQSRQTFGFGTYEWILRASSTSETPEGSGRPVSGQISSGFLFQQDQGYTEIDSPEIEGDKPNQLSWTSWVDSKTREYTATQSPEDPAACFHSYKIHWTHDMIVFYVDNDVVAMHHTHVPQNPAYAMINHWGTNSQGWGGLATPGVDRFMFVKKFSFTPA